MLVRRYFTVLHPYYPRVSSDLEDDKVLTVLLQCIDVRLVQGPRPRFARLAGHKVELTTRTPILHILRNRKRCVKIERHRHQKTMASESVQNLSGIPSAR